MATNKRSLTARVAGGFGAIALATLIALGGALPASAIGPNVNPAMQGQGEITIHKFEQPASSNLGPNNGTEITPTPAPPTGVPLAGVSFSATLVPGTDLTTNAGWQTAAAIRAAGTPTQQAAYAETLIPDGTLPTRTGTTDADGEIPWIGLQLGVYLIEETGTGSNPITNPSPNFLISVPMASPTPGGDAWLYKVHAYPKNSVGAITKEVDDSAAYVLGEEVSWTIDVDVPEMPTGQTFTEFVITDDLDPRLDFVSATVTAGVGTTEPYTPVALTAGTHYSVSPAVATAGGPVVTVTFSTEGRELLAGLNLGHVVVKLTTTVNGLGAGTQTGIIPNTAVANIDDIDITSDEVETLWGLLTVEKHEAGAPTVLLAGAEFAVYNVDPSLPGNESVAAIATGGPSGADGRVTFPALRTGVDYWIVETKAPLGYQLNETPIGPFEVFAGVPAGQEVVHPMANTKIPSYELPITGGSGEAAFMIGGLGLIGTALGFVLIRRRKEQAEA